MFQNIHYIYSFNYLHYYKYIYILYLSYIYCIVSYLLTFTFIGLWTASVREQSAIRGRELLSGREGKAEIISLKVSFKGGS